MTPREHPPVARYAVVLNPGTLFQAIDTYALDVPSVRELARELREEGVAVEIMKCGPRGALLPAEVE